MGTMLRLSGLHARACVRARVCVRTSAAVESQPRRGVKCLR